MVAVSTMPRSIERAAQALVVGQAVEREDLADAGAVLHGPERRPAATAPRGRGSQDTLAMLPSHSICPMRQGPPPVEPGSVVVAVSLVGSVALMLVIAPVEPLSSPVVALALTLPPVAPVVGFVVCR